jgi:DNA invertase Pin-like site-specific DNA recombinase
MQICLYARVSTEDQNVDQQIKYLKEYANKNKYTIVKVVKDIESGTIALLDRKRFKRLLEYAKQNKASICIYNLDRLTRNWEDVVFIEKWFRENWQECKLISTSDEINLDNANGRFMFRVRMAVCCLMPEDMREKQRIGIERAKAQGKYKGRKKGSKNKDK